MLSPFGHEIRQQTPRSRFLKIMTNLWPWEANSELIKIGGSRDGAYLIPDCITGEDVLISPGVGDSTNFEIDLYEKFGVAAILIDPSVEKPRNLPTSFVFEKKFLNTYDDESNITLDRLVMKIPKEKRVLIQMDIEGSEYKILNSIENKTLERTKVLIVEFHNISFWTNRIYFEEIVEPALNRISEYFHPVHVKQNSAVECFKFANYTFSTALEVTYLSKSEAFSGRRVSTLPHHLDVSNSPNHRLIPFPRI